MTDRTTDSSNLLDFPGADRLCAAGAVAAPGPAVLEAALLAVRSAATAEREAAPEVVPLRPRRRGPRTRRLLVSAVAIAAIAAGASVYPVSGLWGSPPAATASAADFLRQVAATEAEGTATDAPYWKARAVQSLWGKPHNPDPSHGHSATPSVHDVSIWMSADSLFFQDGADGEIVRSAGTHGWIKPVAGAPGEDFGWEEVKRLPSDAAALKAVLEEFYPEGPGPDSEAAPYSAYLSTLGNLLGWAPLEPRQRAAVYEVLADMPGLRLVGPVKDSTGRTGTAVEADIRNARIRLIIDPEEGGLLESTASYRGGEHDGKLGYRTTFLSAGPEQSIPPYREPSGKALERPHQSTPAS